MTIRGLIDDIKMLDPNSELREQIITQTLRYRPEVTREECEREINVIAWLKIRARLGPLTNVVRWWVRRKGW